MLFSVCIETVIRESSRFHRKPRRVAAGARPVGPLRPCATGAPRGEPGFPTPMVAPPGLKRGAQRRAGDSDAPASELFTITLPRQRIWNFRQRLSKYYSFIGRRAARLRECARGRRQIPACRKESMHVLCQKPSKKPPRSSGLARRSSACLQQARSCGQRAGASKSRLQNR